MEKEGAPLKVRVWTRTCLFIGRMSVFQSMDACSSDHNQNSGEFNEQQSRMGYTPADDSQELHHPGHGVTKEDDQPEDTYQNTFAVGAFRNEEDEHRRCHQDCHRKREFEKPAVVAKIPAIGADSAETKKWRLQVQLLVEPQKQ